VGNNAETLAKEFLEGQGLATLATQFRSRRGEIDLILRDGRTTVFVEVRYRSSRSFGGALLSIDAKKRLRLEKAALHWLSHNPGVSRFDVIAIDGENIEWLRDAFSTTP
jgi:putative endonuclease